MEEGWEIEVEFCGQTDERTDGRTDGLTFLTLTQVEPENYSMLLWRSLRENMAP